MTEKALNYVRSMVEEMDDFERVKFFEDLISDLVGELMDDPAVSRRYWEDVYLVKKFVKDYLGS
jgi:anionic cell wall polymer biosynthesis LytR-Cps2A-Psr (LCP) family protein